jgi:DNA-binding MltR family transcriptional regulator
MGSNNFPPININWDEFYDILNKSGLFTAAIVGASVLSELLRRLIVHFVFDDMVGKEITKDTHGPAGTFSNRILLSYGLGLITENEYRNLKSIGTIRNKLAHTFGTSDYNESAIINVCNQLTLPIGPPILQEITGQERLKTVLSTESAKLALRPSFFKHQLKFEEFVTKYHIKNKPENNK